MNQPSPKPPRPPYFEVPPPAHFACRSDLLLELGIPEEFVRTWPRDEASLARLCENSGLDRADYDLGQFTQGKPPDIDTGSRHVLVRATLPGRAAVYNMVMNRNGHSVVCEPALADFIFDRAVQFLTWKGIREACARVWLRGMEGENKGSTRRVAPCGIGYEGGLCTILILGQGSERAFLEGRPDFLVPAFPNAKY